MLSWVGIFFEKTFEIPHPISFISLASPPSYVHFRWRRRNVTYFPWHLKTCFRSFRRKNWSHDSNSSSMSSQILWMPNANVSRVSCLFLRSWCVRTHNRFFRTRVFHGFSWGNPFQQQMLHRSGQYIGCPYLLQLLLLSDMSVWKSLYVWISHVLQEFKECFVRQVVSIFIFWITSWDCFHSFLPHVMCNLSTHSSTFLNPLQI